MTSERDTHALWAVYKGGKMSEICCVLRPSWRTEGSYRQRQDLEWQRLSQQNESKMMDTCKSFDGLQKSLASALCR